MKTLCCLKFRFCLSRLWNSSLILKSEDASTYTVSVYILINHMFVFLIFCERLIQGQILYTKSDKIFVPLSLVKKKVCLFRFLCVLTMICLSLWWWFKKCDPMWCHDSILDHCILFIASKQYARMPFSFQSLLAIRNLNA